MARNRSIRSDKKNGRRQVIIMKYEDSHSSPVRVQWMEELKINYYHLVPPTTPRAIDCNIIITSADTELYYGQSKMEIKLPNRLKLRCCATTATPPPANKFPSFVGHPQQQRLVSSTTHNQHLGEHIWNEELYLQGGEWEYEQEKPHDVTGLRMNGVSTEYSKRESF